jgi:hypothetical protein
LTATWQRVNFIDGQALTANSFGQIDATTGEWSPKRYAGTYGTNGFYLPFDGNANDDSGNGNNWTENNLASTDFMIDTPSTNFSVLNPLDKDAVILLSEGNLRTDFFVRLFWKCCCVYGTVGVSTGKWYMETTLNNFTYPGNGQAGGFGMYNGSDRFGAYYSSGSLFWVSVSEGVSSTLGFSGSAVGMVMQIAIDLDAGKLWVGKDGVWNGSGDPDTGANPDRTFTPGGTFKMWAAPIRDASGYWYLTVNAGADSSFAGLKTRQGNTDANGKGDFYYEPAAGFLALCEDNLETLPFSASGGTETTITDGGVDYKVHTFTSSDTLYVQGIGQVEYLVVAGGGGGGGDIGAGGGAGGYREFSKVISPSSYSVVVGSGGSGGTAGVDGSSGNDSSFNLDVSTGGGGGTSNTNGLSGGSGGGGRSATGVGGAGNTPSTSPLQGTNGGNGGDNSGGGGGGAFSAGANGGTYVGGNGGSGISSNITGTLIYRAGGGGGNGYTGSDGTGGIGGGGSGNGASGVANSGGGGGGGDLGVSGGNGGSGIVIIRYPI